ncbi:transposable element Tcb1 transposase [Trichonephila clavipes]|nr:transposable element Tcb1 transposase [Trichonephila clavipes]
MFTDESRFALEPDDKCIRMWRERGTRNQPQNITEHHAFRGRSIMVWAEISLGDRTDLHIFKRGSVTAIRYGDEVLESIVRLCAAVVGPTFVLMDNNARPHRTDIVDDYLKRRDCAYGVSSCFPPPATLIELEIVLQEEWRLLNSAVVYHLIESMVRSYISYIVYSWKPSLAYDFPQSAKGPSSGTTRALGSRVVKESDRG